MPKRLLNRLRERPKSSSSSKGVPWNNIAIGIFKNNSAAAQVVRLPNWVRERLDLMMMIDLPYGDTVLPLTLPEHRLKTVLQQTKLQQAKQKADVDETAIVRDALAHPIASPALRTLAAGKRRVTIITSDHTRPMPSAVTMPLLLEEIRGGAPDAEILILVATGMHRATTAAELAARFGAQICSDERIIVHDCRDQERLRHIGKLPSGGALVLSKYALDTDLLISEGFIEPHFFAGFSGGRKSVLPGVAGYECVISNHCSAFIADERAAAGSLDGNPIHLDMAFAAEKAGLRFILNVILGENREIIEAVAGDPFRAHEEGCARLMKRSAVKRETAPIVITSNGGYPLDQNLYQLVKCMDTAEKCCEEGGVIIAVGECRDGAGGEAFYKDFAGGLSPRELTARFLSCGNLETKADQWQSQILARILEKRRVIVVAPLIGEIVTKMGLGWAENLEQALKTADGLLGRLAGGEPDIIVIPDGPGVVTV